jgi:hypothetical protein
MARRVLIIDDNSAFRTAAQGFWREPAKLLAEAGTSRWHPEANTLTAIVDVQLPDFDGFGLPSGSETGRSAR